MVASENTIVNELPKHLGGHLNKVHTDRGALLFCIKNLNVTSMIDVGCGPGDMVEIARNRGIDAIGVDGDFTLNLSPPNFFIQDFTKGEVILPDKYDKVDLIWSVEFLEHVEEEYIPNYMSTFQRGKTVICTAAPPGWPGHHHVNCQPQEYWFDVFKDYGFEYNLELTNEVKSNSTMKKGFLVQNGMAYKNEN